MQYSQSAIGSIISCTSFGIWGLLNNGADTFGAPVRGNMSPREAIQLLGECGVPRVSLHDRDVGLCPWETPDARQREEQRQTLKNWLEQAGVEVHMYTPCLFHHPVVRAGSLTSNEPWIRLVSLRKIFLALDEANFFRAPWVTLWLGRDGAEVDALIDAKTAYERIVEGIHAACCYIREKGYNVGLSLEPKPNEPRGDIYISTVGTALGIIGMLPPEDQLMVMVNPEVLQHEGMAGLNAYHAISLLIAADKLAFVHLGGQTPLRYDQDHPLLGGNSGIKETFYVFLALRQWKTDSCVLEFDCHPLRTEAGPDARRDFVLSNLEAAGILLDKATEFLCHPAVSEIISIDAKYETGFGIEPTVANDPQGFLEAVQSLGLNLGASVRLDVNNLAASLNPQAQRLDRLVNLHLLGGKL